MISYTGSYSRFCGTVKLRYRQLLSASCRESSCLYLNFTVPQNLEYEPVYEIIPVKPHQLYSLSAYVRSQDITSDSGPRLRVIDPQCATCITAMTPSVIETRAWHKME